MPKKKKTVAKAKKELDTIFSRFIRYRDKGVCFTCGHTNDPKKMQNGHYVPRQYNATRYDERNNNCQCYACNMLYGGQPDLYTLKLETKYGKQIVKELNKLRYQVVKFTVPDLERMKEEYKEKLSGVIY